MKLLTILAVLIIIVGVAYFWVDASNSLLIKLKEIPAQILIGE